MNTGNARLPKFCFFDKMAAIEKKVVLCEKIYSSEWLKSKLCYLITIIYRISRGRVKFSSRSGYFRRNFPHRLSFREKRF